MGRRRLCGPARARLAIGLVLLGAAACTSGTIEESPAGDNPAAPSARDSSTGSGKLGSHGSSGNPGAADGCRGVACETESAVASSAFPRLSHRQWAASVRDLLYLDAAPDVSGFSSDAPTEIAFDDNGGALVVSTGLASDYEALAEKLA